MAPALMPADRPTEVDPTSTVAAETILAAHRAAQAAACSTLEHARTAGDLLTEAKAALPHGQWLPWLAASCPGISPRTAQLYMRVARRWSDIEPNAKRVSHFGLRDAVAVVAAPRPARTRSKLAPRVLDTELVPVRDLKPHPRNYKGHPPEQIAHIRRSIEEHGFYRNVVIARDNTVLAGHGVLEASKSMGPLGPTHIPCIRLDIDPEEPRALKVLTSDNELGKMAASDDRQLTEVLREVKTADDLLGTGFDPMNLAALTMVTRPKSEIRDFDAAAEWVGMPEYVSTPEPLKVVVQFENEAARERFMKAIGATVVNKKAGTVWSIWYPERQKEDLSSVKFEALEPQTEAQR